MTDRLADIEARIGTVHQLSSVISAMRGIAAARTVEANRHLESIRTYSETIASAIGRGLSLSSAAHPKTVEEKPGDGRHIVIVLCAEQGFAGSFSQRILDGYEAVQDQSTHGRIELLLVGDRGIMTALERGLKPQWSASMIASTDHASLLATRIMEALYVRIDNETGIRVTLIYATPHAAAGVNVVQKQIVPFDFGRFPPVRQSQPPLLNLAPEVLLSQLTNEYIFAELCEAIILSYAAENEARMRAMISAQENVSETLEDLTAAARRQRQNEITDEISELSASRLRQG